MDIGVFIVQNVLLFWRTGSCGTLPCGEFDIFAVQDVFDDHLLVSSW